MKGNFKKINLVTLTWINCLKGSFLGFAILGFLTFQKPTKLIKTKKGNIKNGEKWTVKVVVLFKKNYKNLSYQIKLR